MNMLLELLLTLGIATLLIGSTLALLQAENTGAGRPLTEWAYHAVCATRQSAMTRLEDTRIEVENQSLSQTAASHSRILHLPQGRLSQNHMLGFKASGNTSGAGTLQIRNGNRTGEVTIGVGFGQTALKPPKETAPQ